MKWLQGDDKELLAEDRESKLKHVYREESKHVNCLASMSKILKYI